MMIACDCGDVFPLPDGFFDGAAVAFWEHHGHFPNACTFRCACGAHRVSGPEGAAAHPRTARADDEAWYRVHCGHLAPAD